MSSRRTDSGCAVGATHYTESEYLDTTPAHRAGVRRYKLSIQMSSASSIDFLPIRTSPRRGSPSNRTSLSPSPTTCICTAATPLNPASAPLPPPKITWQDAYHQKGEDSITIHRTFRTKLLNSRWRPGSTSNGISTIFADTAKIEPSSPP